MITAALFTAILLAQDAGASVCRLRQGTDTSSATAQAALLPYYTTLTERCQRYEAREDSMRKLYYGLAFGGLFIGAAGGLAGVVVHGDNAQKKIAQAASLLTGLASGILGVGHFDSEATAYHQCVTATARAQAKVVAEYGSFTTITPGDSASLTDLRRAIEQEIQTNCAQP